MRTFGLLAVVGVVAMFVGCGENSGNSSENEENATTKAEVASGGCAEVLDESKVESDGEGVAVTSFGPVKFGDGSVIGDHNISVIHTVDGAAHVAILRIVKKTENSVETVKEVKLNEETAELTMTADLMLSMTVYAGTSKHYVNQSDLTFQPQTDVKIAAYSPWTGGTPAIIGAEDPRASLVKTSDSADLKDLKDFKGNIVAVNFKENRKVRIGQKQESGVIRLSTNYTNSIKKAGASPYCLTGVSRWGYDFSIVCQ